MKKFISIDKTENYTICLFEHRLFEICDHYLISFSLDRFSMKFPYDLLNMERIDKDNMQYLKNIGFNYITMSKYILEKNEPIDGFMFFTQDKHEPVGCIWVMYKGGNEAQYRIRNIDAFGFYFAVFPKFRGNRYIEYFIYRLLKHIERKGINKLYASVRKNNESALRAYSRAGMKIESSKRFYRFIKWRIPYPII